MNVKVSVVLAQSVGCADEDSSQNKPIPSVPPAKVSLSKCISAYLGEDVVEQACDVPTTGLTAAVPKKVFSQVTPAAFEPFIPMQDLL